MKPQACHRGNTSAYDDGNIPEIDLPGTSNAAGCCPFIIKKTTAFSHTLPSRKFFPLF